MDQLYRPASPISIKSGVFPLKASNSARQISKIASRASKETIVELQTLTGSLTKDFYGSFQKVTIVRGES